MGENIGANIKDNEVIITVGGKSVIKIHINGTVWVESDIYVDILNVQLLNPVESTRVTYVGNKLESINLEVRRWKMKND